jgi:hypothetical protein
MVTPGPDSLDGLPHAELIALVRELIGEVKRVQAENEKLSGTLTKLKVDYQAVKDELARLKGLPPRPPHNKPSGMDKATDRGGEAAGGAKGETSKRRRGSNLDRLKIDATVVVRAKAPAGSRHKGYEEIVVQDLALNATVTCYRRERWETPEPQSGPAFPAERMEDHVSNIDIPKSVEEPESRSNALVLPIPRATGPISFLEASSSASLLLARS